jgi:hypothetical protein
MPSRLAIEPAFEDVKSIVLVGMADPRESMNTDGDNSKLARNQTVNPDIGQIVQATRRTFSLNQQCPLNLSETRDATPAHLSLLGTRKPHWELREIQIGFQALAMCKQGTLESH